CFLTDEARPISNIVASILHCALDFRSCLVKKSGNAGGDEINFTGNLSQINISQGAPHPSSAANWFELFCRVWGVPVAPLKGMLRRRQNVAV
ncbi:hypothetical protein AKJ16_DCAP21986, partial [Drosera capensis]